MAFLDKIKAKATELKLDEKAALAKEKAAAAAGENRGKIAQAVDKAAQTVDTKTGGKYSDKIVKASEAAKKGVDKVAAQGTTTPSSTLEDNAAAQESRVQRAVGADAPTSVVEPNTSGITEDGGQSSTLR